MAVGIKDVARLAGVSAATVSRVLGNGPVSLDLRTRVEAAVKASGYRPNLSARRLRSQHSRTVGLIVSDISNPFFIALIRAVEEEAYRAEMRVILCNTDENPTREAMYLRLMQEERVTGLIYAPTRKAAEHLDRIDFEFPVALVDRTGPPGGHDCVVIDNAGAAARLVDHLAGQGLSRIVGIFGNTSSTAVERHQGYELAMRQHGLFPEARFVAPSPDAAKGEMRRLMAEHAAEAVIASNGQVLLGCALAVKEMGLRLPDDLALAGFDNETWTELVGPGLTVIEQPVGEIGRAAMGLLFDRLQHPDAPARKTILDGRLIRRGSTLVLPEPAFSPILREPALPS